MAKATVQAALGPVCLKRVKHSGDEDPLHHQYADLILMICVLSIVLTAPIGAILISITGPRLLTKTKQPPPTEGKFKIQHSSIIKKLKKYVEFQVGVAAIDQVSMISVLSMKKRNVMIPNVRQRKNQKPSTPLQSKYCILPFYVSHAACCSIET